MRPVERVEGGGGGKAAADVVPGAHEVCKQLRMRTQMALVADDLNGSGRTPSTIDFTCLLCNGTKFG